MWIDKINWRGLEGDGTQQSNMKVTNTVPLKEKKIIAIINEEYARAKKILNPLLKGVNRSFVKFRWIKKDSKCGGVCWRYCKTIALNRKYRDDGTGKWSEDNMRMTIRHEIVHLTNDGRGHGGKFLSLLKLIKGHRFVGEPIYEGIKK